MNYYNEWDPDAAKWLQRLIDAHRIPQGHVDTRSITEVHPGDLKGYTACHFFAGIGGWPLALQMAGWPSERQVWSGSCPCQPFSSAGKHNGTSDDRHLWPHLYRLIEACKPPTVFGEQVAGKAGLSWLDAVSSDLEASGYSTGAADLSACSVGAPHIRRRLYWVGHSSCERLEGHARHGDDQREAHSTGSAATTGTRNDWHTEDWAVCYHPSGELRRPIEPGTLPVAHGLPDRVVQLRGYGNAVVPQVASEFIGAFLETLNETQN